MAVPTSAHAAPEDILFRTRPLDLLNPGDRVVCVYDSSEGTSENANPLSGEVARAIGKRGFVVSWHDLAKGLPSATSLVGARAVVTGFLDSTMPEPRGYIEFVRKTAMSGVRFVIIGNFGAFQDSASGAFIELDQVNRAFEALGVRYSADWTDNPALFDLNVIDDRLTTAERMTAQAVRHFYQFTPVGRDVRPLVTARRKDRTVADSVVVFTSSTGAMALSRYLTSDDTFTTPSAVLGDIQRFMDQALARWPVSPTSVLVLFDPTSEDSQRAVSALETSSSYSGIALSGVRLTDLDNLRPMDIQVHAGFVLAIAELRGPHAEYLASIIRSSLSNGGRVLTVLPIRDPEVARAFGHSGDVPGTYKASGIVFGPGLFPGVDGVEVKLNEPSFSGFAVRLGDNCQALAVTADSRKIPVWWRCSANGGQSMALNAFEFADRATVGLVLQALVDTVGPWAMPVLASAVEFVDDCPLPMTKRYLDVLGKEDAEFYVEDYYETIRATARELNFSPTFLAVFSYGDETEPPYLEPFAGIGYESSRLLARRIVADDFPIGLHGTNHVSPAVSGGVTKSFSSLQALKTNFAVARQSFTEVFGQHVRPVVYVPPNDYIDRVGKAALVAENPSIRILSSVFAGSTVETMQDFGRDPDQPALTGFPRTHAGAVLEGETLLGLLNGVFLLAVSSHFVHPDDALDPERAHGLDWHALNQAYREGARMIRQRWPFLREMTVTKAVDEVHLLDSTGLLVERTAPGRIDFTRAPGIDRQLTVLVNMDMVCRPDVVGGELVFSDPGSGRSFIRMNQGRTTVFCRGENPAGNDASEAR